LTCLNAPAADFGAKLLKHFRERAGSAGALDFS